MSLLLYKKITSQYFATRTVVIGPKWVNQAQFAGIFSAIQEGFYKENGLSVSVKEFDFETSYLDDLLSGKTDFTIMSVEEFLTYVDQGKNITAVAAIYQVSPYALVSLKESGIKDPSDFVGKKLGIKGEKLKEELVYRLLMNSFGLKIEDSEIIKVGFENSELEDLKTNKIDVVDLYRTDQLYYFEKDNIDYEIIYPDRYGINIYNDLIVTRNDIVQEDPELIKSFMSATIKGWEFAINNKSKAVEDTLKYVTSDIYKDPDYQLYILEKSIPLIKPDSNSKIGSMSYDGWDVIYNTMLKNNIIFNDIDISKVFTTRYLE